MNKTLTLDYKCGQFEDFEEMKKLQENYNYYYKKKIIIFEF